MTGSIVNPQSISEIIRASTILLIRLNNIYLGSWIKEPVGDLMVRDVNMQVTIEELLKGEVRQQVGVPFDLKVQQRGTGDFVVMDYYGLWSHVPLADGVRFVAFCRSNSDDATVLLKDDTNCEQLLEADIALVDTKAALQMEAVSASKVHLLANAEQQADQRGDIFARYVLAKTMPIAEQPSFTQQLTTDFNNWEKLIQIIEDPKTANSARVSYLTSIYEQLGMMSTPPAQWEVRLIQAMFKILLIPEAVQLHSNIAQVYLPNILGLNNEAPRYSVLEVFSNRTDEQQTLLKSQSELSPSLKQWLQGADD